MSNQLKKVYLQFLQEQMSADKALPTGVPIPAKFRTEDGWEFELNSDRLAYESADGSIMLIGEVLRLLLMNDQERENDMFPNFNIEDWKVF